MQRIVFDEVKVKATFKWTDAEGKKRQKTQAFSQTVNPFNKDSNGTVKTRMQIHQEVMDARSAWLAEQRMLHGVTK